MPSINAVTGRLFTDAELGEDMKQSVYDRVTSPIGERPFHPEYGTLLAQLGPEDDRIPPSITAAVSGDSRVHSVEFEVNRGRRALQVFINRRYLLSVA